MKLRLKICKFLWKVHLVIQNMADSMPNFINEVNPSFKPLHCANRAMGGWQCNFIQRLKAFKWSASKNQSYRMPEWFTVIYQVLCLLTATVTRQNFCSGILTRSKFKIYWSFEKYMIRFPIHLHNEILCNRNVCVWSLEKLTNLSD